MITQMDVEQNLATLRQCAIALTQHAREEPNLVIPEAAHLMSAWNEIAVVMISLGIVQPAPLRMTHRVKGAA